MRDEQFDAYDPHRGPTHPSDDPRIFLNRFIGDFEDFLDAVIADPPPGVRGEWFDEMARAWLESRAAQRAGVETRIQDKTPDAFEPAGLSGSALRAKLDRWRDSARSFFALRSTKRLAHALGSAEVILGSLASVLGVGHAYQEVVQGVRHLTDIAIDEASP